MSPSLNPPVISKVGRRKAPTQPRRPEMPQSREWDRRSDPERAVETHLGRMMSGNWRGREREVFEATRFALQLARLAARSGGHRVSFVQWPPSPLTGIGARTGTSYSSYTSPAFNTVRNPKLEHNDGVTWTRSSLTVRGSLARTTRSSASRRFSVRARGRAIALQEWRSAAYCTCFRPSAADSAQLMTVEPHWIFWLDNAWYGTAIAVASAWRRQGVGRSLVEARIEAAKAAHARAFLTQCVVGSGSTELYASLGFEPLIQRGGAYATGEDSQLMALKLGEPSREAYEYMHLSSPLVRRWRVASASTGLAAALVASAALALRPQTVSEHVGPLVAGLTIPLPIVVTTKPNSRTVRIEPPRPVPYWHS